MACHPHPSVRRLLPRLRHFGLGKELRLHLGTSDPLPADLEMDRSHDIMSYDYHTDVMKYSTNRIYTSTQVLNVEYTFLILFV